MRSSLPKPTMCLGLSSTMILLITFVIAPNYPHSLHGLGQRIGHQNLPDLVRKYLVQHAHPNANADTHQPPTTPHHINPSHAKRLKVFHSACAVFCTPSNPSTAAGMFHETIWATPSWNRGEIPGLCYDCVFISNGEGSESSLSGLLVACILLFFSFSFGGEHQCALVYWFSVFGNQPGDVGRNT